MAERMIKLPDVGEGVAEAEIVEVPVKAGDAVREGDMLAAVMTDKATVEIPSPADGRVSWIGWEIGQKAAVGSEFIKLEVGDMSSHPAAAEYPGRSQRTRHQPPRERAADVDVSQRGTAQQSPQAAGHRRRANRRTGRLPPPRCGRMRAIRASICASCRAAARPVASCARMLTPTSRGEDRPTSPPPGRPQYHGRRDQDCRPAAEDRAAHAGHEAARSALLVHRRGRRHGS